VKPLLAAFGVAAAFWVSRLCVPGSDTGGDRDDLWGLVSTNRFPDAGTQLFRAENGEVLSRFVGTNLFSKTNFFRMPTNLIMPFLSDTNRGPGASPEKRLSPGVYLSEPYACIVIVPDLHADASMVIKPQSGNDRLHVIQPKVEFVPWAEAGVPNR
jgi:hypothetical protein